LLAARVGLKPRITEGHERAMGLVAAFLRARDEKGLREWPWHIAATPAPKCEIRFTPPIGGRCLCTDCSKPSRTTSPLASILAPSRIWSAPLPLSAWPGPCRVFSLLKTRRPPCASPVGRGSPRRPVGAGRFYADSEGFRLASLPSADGGDDEHGALVPRLTESRSLA